MAINPALIDIEVPRGCLPRETSPGEEWPLFGDTDIDVIPRNQWQEIVEQGSGLDDVVCKIKNQRNEGSCASNATAQCFEVVWNMMLGLDWWVEISPISIYRWVGSGPNSGSTIDGNLRQLREVGCLPCLDNENNVALMEKLGLNPAHRLKNVGYYQNFPEGWEETAKQFRSLEWFDISSFDEFVTCLLCDYPVCYGRAGHAICGVAPKYDNGTWYIKYANSWGDWGDQGYGYDSESYISRSISSYGAWGLRSVQFPSALGGLL